MKRIFDICFALILMCTLSPFFLLLLIVVILKIGAPIFHYSNRVGRDNIIFQMPKFRTMKAGTPVVATHLLNNPREYLLPFGIFLRKYSLDELPQIWSIFVGNMSFVGPRPALSTQHDLIQLRSQHGLDKLRPGLTGLAQISGRDELSIEDKVSFECEYLKKKTFFFDLIIIIRTFKIALFGIGISH